MITFACILKSGGDFTLEYVKKLRHQINNNYSDPHQFICLTDLYEEVGACGVPLLYDLPGWWSKFEVFRLYPGPIVYLDLDNIIVGSLESLNGLLDISTNTFFNLKAFRDGDRGSSVMAWTGDYKWILETFLEHYYKGNVFKTVSGSSLIWDGKTYPGDQDLLRNILCDEPKHFINELGLIVKSYKWHCGDRLPPEAHIVGFHGKPRPPDALAPWVRKYWERKFHA